MQFSAYLAVDAAVAHLQAEEAWAIVDERVWTFLRVAVSVASDSMRRRFRRL